MKLPHENARQRQERLAICKFIRNNADPRWIARFRKHCQISGRSDWTKELDYFGLAYLRKQAGSLGYRKVNDSKSLTHFVGDENEEKNKKNKH